jgi:hypothetical protein
MTDNRDRQRSKVYAWTRGSRHHLGRSYRRGQRHRALRLRHRPGREDQGHAKSSDIDGERSRILAQPLALHLSFIYHRSRSGFHLGSADGISVIGHARISRSRRNGTLPGSCLGEYSVCVQCPGHPRTVILGLFPQHGVSSGSPPSRVWRPSAAALRLNTYAKELAPRAR